MAPGVLFVESRGMPRVPTIPCLKSLGGPKVPTFTFLESPGVPWVPIICFLESLGVRMAYHGPRFKWTFLGTIFPKLLEKDFQKGSLKLKRKDSHLPIFGVVKYCCWITAEGK